MSNVMFIVSYVVCFLVLIYLYKNVVAWIYKIEAEVEKLYTTKHYYQEQISTLFGEVNHIKKNFHKRTPRRRMINNKLKNSSEILRGE